MSQSGRNALLILDVLVIPKRVVTRFSDLEKEEVADMFNAVQEIGSVVEKKFNATSLTLTIQDGPQAGQTVYHVHMHIIPRVAGDWLNNDDIYGDIERNERELPKILKKGPDNDDRKPRTVDEMAQEAADLKSLFNQYEDIWST